MNLGNSARFRNMRSLGRRLGLAAMSAGLMAALSPIALPAATPPPGPRESVSAHAHFHISTREQWYIRDWYRRHPSRNHGRPLPQQYRLRAGGRLPPAGMYTPLPAELVRNLQHLPEGYGYFRVGFDVIIADLHHGIVVDVVYGLLNR